MGTGKNVSVTYVRLRKGYDVKTEFAPAGVSSEEQLAVTDAATEAFTQHSPSTLCAGNVRVEHGDGCSTVVVRIFVAEDNARGGSSEVDFSQCFRYFRDTVLPKRSDALPGKYYG